MRVYLASDHAGFEMKNHLLRRLDELGHEVRDLGPAEFDPDDAYPPYCIEAGIRVMADEGSLGVVVGGSGNGEQMAANKVRGVRAALAWSIETASLAREHNDARIVAIGARMHTLDEAADDHHLLRRHPFLGGPTSPRPHRDARSGTRRVDSRRRCPSADAGAVVTVDRRGRMVSGSGAEDVVAAGRSGDDPRRPGPCRCSNASPRSASWHGRRGTAGRARRRCR